MSTTSDILEWMKDDPTFLGCIKAKKLQHLKPQTLGCFVIHHRGHWVALRCTPKYCLYFDAAHQKIPRSVLQWMRRTGKKIYSSKYRLQHENSTKCGEFCVVFLSYVTHVKHYKRFYRYFSLQKLYKNDVIVSSVVNKVS